ncbi:uncharacterized protein ACO6RY_10330 [Pungitius sinensis]
MSRGNNQRNGGIPPLLWSTPQWYNERNELSRAMNEVHYWKKQASELSSATKEVHNLKRQVSELNGYIETLKASTDRRLDSQVLAYTRTITTLSDMTRENEGLSLKLTETTEQLSVKSAELTVNNNIWQQKYDDLESKVTGLLSTNGSLQEELHVQRARNHQLEAEHKLLKIKTEALAETIRENEGVSLKLTETTEQLSVKSAELTVNNKIWQQKYDDLQSKVTGLLSTNGSSQEELHLQRARNHQLEAEHKLLKIKTDALAETIRENEGLSLKLTETTEQLSELTVTNKTWQQKYNDLEKKTSNELNCQQQSLESRVTGLLSTNGSLQETMDMQRAKSRLEAEHKLLKIETEALAALQNSQEETHHEVVSTSESCLIAKIRQMEDTIAKGDQILITRIQDLEDDKTLLENICLDLKKKKRGIFGRRMQDRQTEMDKMRRKMQESKK